MTQAASNQGVVQANPRTAERIAEVLPRLPERQAAELALMVDALVATFQPECIYVFGSQARGDARPDSDVDLMVVLTASDEPSYRREQVAYGAIGLHRFPVDILVRTHEEFEYGRVRYWTVTHEVAREGRMVYAAT